MESLALMVAIIFLTVLLVGPLTLILWHYNFTILCLLASVLCLIIGGFWVGVAPFPVSLVGFFNVLTGLFVITKTLFKI